MQPFLFNKEPLPVTPWKALPAPLYRTQSMHTPYLLTAHPLWLSGFKNHRGINAMHMERVHSRWAAAGWNPDISHLSNNTTLPSLGLLS